MEKSSAKFLSNMSHELRTPLNVIVGMCDIARYHIEDSLKVRECLDKISNASDHLTDLLNDLLDISRMEQGAMPLNEDIFDLADMMEELRFMIEPMAAGKKQTCIISADGLRNSSVIGSQRHVMQILINLATNAVKYTPEGGVIKIRADEIYDPETGKYTYRFTCQDSGIGMTREFAERIFEPFVRADDVRVGRVTGTGLGMSIVKEIVDAMGGTIYVDSIKDVGTNICVFLEMRPAGNINGTETVQEDDGRESEDAVTERRVLVAEDRADNQEVLAGFLQTLGYDSDIASNGEEAVDMFMNSAEGCYKAVFMDMEMPVMDGCQSVMMMRGLNRSDVSIPVIAMTANAFNDDRNRAKQAGMDDYLIKPFKMCELQKILQIWVEKADDIK